LLAGNPCNGAVGVGYWSAPRALVIPDGRIPAARDLKTVIRPPCANVTPFLPGGASPDTEGKAMPQGEVQAWYAHRTGLADPLGLVSLPYRGAGRTFREEQLGIVVTARGAVTLVRGVARGGRRVPHRCSSILTTTCLVGRS